MNKTKKRKNFLKVSAAALAAVSVLSTSSCSLYPKLAGTDISGKVMVICKNANVEFWDDVCRGAREAGSEIGFDVKAESGNSDTDVDTQRTLIQEAIDKDYKAIIIAPNDTTKLNDLLHEAANEHHIKIININNELVFEDTPLKSGEVETIIKSNDIEGGKTAAREAAKLLLSLHNNNLTGNGKFVMFGHPSGTAKSRIQGFEEEMANQILAHPATPRTPSAKQELSINKTSDEFSDEEIQNTTTYAEPALTVDTILKDHFTEVYAQDTDDIKIQAQKLAVPSVLNSTPLIFCTNTETTELLCSEIEKAVGNDKAYGEELKKKIVIIGFNSSQQEMDYMEHEYLDGTIIQNPYLMGYISVRYVKELLQNKSVPNNTDPGIMYINKLKSSADYVDILINSNSGEDEETDEEDKDE